MNLSPIKDVQNSNIPSSIINISQEAKSLQEIKSNMFYSGFGVIIDANRGVSSGFQTLTDIKIIDPTINNGSKILPYNLISFHIYTETHQKWPRVLRIGDIIRFHNFFFRIFPPNNHLKGLCSSKYAKAQGEWELYHYKEGFEKDCYVSSSNTKSNDCPFVLQKLKSLRAWVMNFLGKSSIKTFQWHPGDLILKVNSKEYKNDQLNLKVMNENFNEYNVHLNSIHDSLINVDDIIKLSRIKEILPSQINTDLESTYAISIPNEFLDAEIFSSLSFQSPKREKLSYMISGSQIEENSFPSSSTNKLYSKENKYKDQSFDNTLSTSTESKKLIPKFRKIKVAINNSSKKKVHSPKSSFDENFLEFLKIDDSNIVEIENLAQIKSNSICCGFGIILDSDQGVHLDGIIKTTIKIIDHTLNPELMKIDNKYQYITLQICSKKYHKIPIVLKIGDIIRFDDFYFISDKENIMRGFFSEKEQSSWLLYHYKDVKSTKNQEYCYESSLFQNPVRYFTKEPRLKALRIWSMQFFSKLSISGLIGEKESQSQNRFLARIKSVKKLNVMMKITFYMEKTFKVYVTLLPSHLQNVLIPHSIVQFSEIQNEFNVENRQIYAIGIPEEYIDAIKLKQDYMKKWLETHETTSKYLQNEERILIEISNNVYIDSNKHLVEPIKLQESNAITPFKEINYSSNLKVENPVLCLSPLIATPQEKKIERRESDYSNINSPISPATPNKIINMKEDDLQTVKRESSIKQKESTINMWSLLNSEETEIKFSFPLKLEGTILAIYPKTLKESLRYECCICKRLEKIENSLIMQCCELQMNIIYFLKMLFKDKSIENCNEFLIGWIVSSQLSSYQLFPEVELNKINIKTISLFENKFQNGVRELLTCDRKYSIIILPMITNMKSINGQKPMRIMDLRPIIKN